MILACIVAAIIDGDTFDARCPQPVRVRLADVTSDAGDAGDVAMVAAGFARRWPHDNNGRAMAQRKEWC